MGERSEAGLRAGDGADVGDPLTNSPKNSLVTSISAFFPCFNDAHTIEAMVRRVSEALAELVDDFEVVVVDDGSQDDSLGVLRRLERELPWLRIVAHPVNRGYGGALRSGFAAATKEWIFYTDGDGQYDPVEVATLVRAIRPDVDVAQGCKIGRGDGRGRRMIGRAYHFAVARLFNLHVRDTDCDFRLFPRSLVERADLRCDSGAICVEMVRRFEGDGARFVEVPVHHYPRSHGRSQFFRLPHLARTAGELVRLWIRIVALDRRRRSSESTVETETAGRASKRRVFVGLAAIVVLSLGAHLWGLVRDLPVPDVDERYFVTPAAYMAASGDANPHWFGHPGSTVIYPLALAFRMREVVFHGAPLIGPAPSVAARFRADPRSFYLLGRLWAVLFSLAALPLAFMIGRRVFGVVAAFLGTAVWAAVPLGVQYGRITRTDSVALFFALLAIWACLRAVEHPSTVRFAIAGTAAGLGVASRYFLAVLAVLLVATWLAARRRQEERLDAPDHLRGQVAAPRALVAGLVTMGAAFALTTPYFFLDWHDAMTSLTAETVSRAPNQAAGFLDNIVFYLTSAIPGAISWLCVGAAVLGIALAIRRPVADKTLLLIWVLCVLAVISVLSLHWSRWIIPALPILALFAADALITSAHFVAARIRWRQTRRWTLIALVGVGSAAMIAGPASALVKLDHQSSVPSTRVVALNWVEHHLRPDSGVAVEIKGPDLTATSYRYVEHYALPLRGTIADYERSGFRYLVINEGIALRYRRNPSHYRTQAAFYDFLRDDARVLATFHDNKARAGPNLMVYDLHACPRHRRIDVTGERDEQTTLRPSYPNRAGQFTGPVPFAQHELHRLRLEAREIDRTRSPASTSVQPGRDQTRRSPLGDRC